MDAVRPELGFAVHTCGLTPAVREAGKEIALAGQAAYLVAGNLLGYTDARPVVPNAAHPLPTSALALGFTTKSAMTVSSAVAAWVTGGDGPTPAFGANLYAYLRSLQYRAEILGLPTGEEQTRIYVPDPETNPTGFRTATELFFRLFHHRAAGNQDPPIQQEIDRERYYTKQIDGRLAADFGFPLLNGEVFTYAKIALPAVAPVPPNDQVAVSRRTGASVPVLWLMRLLGITCPPAADPANVPAAI